jgi:uncharacterized protein
MATRSMRKPIKILIIATILVASLIYIVLNFKSTGEKRREFVADFQKEYVIKPNPSVLENRKNNFFIELATAAEERTAFSVTYDPSYVTLDYPGGDVPPDRGVCTDVIIRSYRKLGIDLQVKVHEDMKNNFNSYPKIWNLKKPDLNIDHRRVPNLMVFFKRHGTVLPKSRNPDDYAPGDIVTWNLSGGVTHIGIVSTKKDSSNKRYKVVHNIGAGPKLEDALFKWEITGHFRYN